jgi:apolipoprotein N-acyltransferase
MVSKLRLPLGLGPTVVCLLSGLLLTAAFPNLGLWPLAFMAWSPMLVATAGRDPGQAFWAGFLAGLAHFSTLLYWIIIVLVQYGNLPWLLAGPVFVLLVGYLALYPAFFVYLLNLAGRRLSLRIGGLVWVLVGAVCYTGLEYIKSFLLTGFPWEPLGSALAGSLTMVQLADLVGSGGLTFLVVLVNMALAAAFMSFRSRGWSAAVWPVALGLAVLVVLAGYGAIRLAQVREEMARAESKTVSVVQGSIEQSLKWNPDQRIFTMLTYRDLTQKAAANKPWLVVWPETAMPFFFQNDQTATEWLEAMVRETGSALLFGGPAFEEVGQETHYFNRAYLLDGRGKVLDHYDKVHLVPFGEYVPLQKYLTFVKKLTQAAGDYVAGPGARVLTLDGTGLGVLICYESIFPELARRQVQAGSDYLVVITNDAWFGRSSAPYQHFSMAVLRAVENRRAVIRAANTGISGLILPSGETVETLGLFERQQLTGSLPSLEIRTIYTAWGDLTSIICFVVMVLFLAAPFMRRKRHV